jgi:ferrous iron transport protein B
LRRPRIGQILVRSLLDRTLKIAGRALTVAAPAGIILWTLAQLGWLQTFGDLLNPLGVALGMNGVILLGFVLSLPANELLIPVILMTMTGATTLQGTGAEDIARLLTGWSMETLICTMIFTLFHWPCATTILTIYKETGDHKKTAAAVLLPTAVGAMLCICLHVLLQYLGG